MAKISVFRLYSLIYLKLRFVWDKDKVLFLSCKCSYPICPTAFVKDAVISSMCIVALFLKDWVAISMLGYIWVFSYVPSVNVFIFIPGLCCF